MTILADNNIMRVYLVQYICVQWHSTVMYNKVFLNVIDIILDCLLYMVVLALPR